MALELQHIESLTLKTLSGIVIVLILYACAVSPYRDDLRGSSEPRISATVQISAADTLNLTIARQPDEKSTEPQPATPNAAKPCAPSGSSSCTVSKDQPPEWWNFIHFRGFLLTFTLYGTLLISTIIIGGFLGFLFGIPRQIQRALSEELDNKVVKFVGNTNLEEISDWLTKILIGLGLTQAGKLYGGFIVAKDEFATISMANAPGADAMFTTVVLSGIILGFLTIYMETRTRVTLLLVASDHVQTGYGAEQILAETVRSFNEDQELEKLGFTKIGTDVFPVPASEKDRKIATLPVEGDRDFRELVALAVSQVRTGNFLQAERALSKAMRKSPDRLDPQLQSALAAVKNRAGEPMAANEILERAAKRHPDNAALWREKLLASLYLEPPQSYISALAAAHEVVQKDEKASSDPFVQLWIACANGQKFKYLADILGQRRSAHADDLNEARSEALKAVRAVIANSEPGTIVRKALREVFDPATHKSVNPTDNDLEVFKSDQEFVDEISKAT